MFGWLNRLWAWVSSLWTNLSDEDKEKIVNIIVSSFTALFKAFYQASKADKKMNKLSLKQFLKKQQERIPDGRSGNLPANIKEKASLAISSTMLAYGMSVTKKQANEFSSEVMEISTSDKVIKELSEKVGTPLESETEDEFVQRASSALKSILMSKLGSK